MRPAGPSRRAGGAGQPTNNGGAYGPCGGADARDVPLADALVHRRRFAACLAATMACEVGLMLGWEGGAEQRAIPLEPKRTVPLLGAPAGRPRVPRPQPPPGGASQPAGDERRPGNQTNTRAFADGFERLRLQ